MIIIIELIIVIIFSSSGVGDFRIKHIQTVTIKNTAY